MMNEWIISSSILIAAVLAVRFALRGRISLRLQYALWAVVLLRLLLPVQLFTSDLGTGAIAQSVDISEPVRQVYVSANENRYEQKYDEAYRQVVARYESSSQSYDPIVVEREAQTIAEKSMELDMKGLLYHLWFAGMVVMTSVIVSCNLHLGLQLKRRRWEFPIADSLLPVYVTEAVPTPCIFGLFRPAIYLTPEATKDDRVREHVLTHELTHYRHWDHIWSVLRSLCLVLHWYNPLVWIAARVSRADAELACDEGALAKLGEDHRGDYGRTLIGLTCGNRVDSMFLNATTMTGSAGSIRERIKLLMKRPRNTILTLTAVILIGVLIVGCTFAGAPETTQPGIDLEGMKEAIENGDVTFDFPDTTEPTGHAPDNDMSYREEDLPIPEEPDSIFIDEGVLVYPGTYWNMTPEQLIAALDIQPEDIADERRWESDGTMDGIYASHDLYITDTFLNHPAEITFMFNAYAPNHEPGLFQIYVKPENTVDYETFRQELTELWGQGEDEHGQTYWESEKLLQDCVDQQAYEAFQKDRRIGYTASRAYVSSFAYDYNGIVLVLYSDIPRAIQLGSVVENKVDNDMSYQGDELPIPEESGEAAITDTLAAFFLAYEENINLNADHSYDHLTVLAADPERTVTYQGKTVPLSDFHGNIEYLHGKEAYWRQVRQDSGIVPSTFQVTSHIEEIAYDGDTAFVLAYDHVTFYYEGQGVPSGMGADFEITLVQVDGEWLIADVFERNDWFDAENKNDPDFDPDALIASYIP